MQKPRRFLKHGFVYLQQNPDGHDSTQPVNSKELYGIIATINDSPQLQLIDSRHVVCEKRVKKLIVNEAKSFLTNFSEVKSPTNGSSVISLLQVEDLEHFLMNQNHKLAYLSCIILHVILKLTNYDSVVKEIIARANKIIYLYAYNLSNEELSEVQVSLVNFVLNSSTILSKELSDPYFQATASDYPPIPKWLIEE